MVTKNRLVDLPPPLTTMTYMILNGASNPAIMKIVDDASVIKIA